MNKFVQMYKNAVKNKLSSETHEYHYRITASVIAQFGTIEDLQALDDYFEREREERIYEKDSIVELKIS